MSDFQKTLDDIFVEKLGYEYDRIECIIPEIADSENILSYRREYVGINVNIIIVECRDRRPEFQKEFIRKEKDKFPNSYFLFVCNDGKVIDLYNDATSKNLKKITYDEISLNTSLFKEKIRLFNVERAENGTELQINAEKAFETNDKVAKSFFDKFQKIHKKLRSAITGITDEKDLSWYASVLMNRFMFIYFLQKHNVIQDNPNYLLDQFAEVTKKAKDYYHDFLLPLFFYGFARKDTNPAKRMFTAEYGDIRYLNGGLFYPHIVEKKYTPTDVSVEYYEEKAIKTAINVNARKVREVLEFLNGYTWYLDQRPMKKDTDINPDVLGYIFEKYINQKELGAYYTKEDITEYIAKNTIIPFIFDKMKSNGYNAPDASPLITDNEDIIAAADSYIASISNYGQLKFLYKDVLNELSVLDPSVGSGAFLFAALNVLLPIYQKVVFMLRKFTDSANDKWLTEQLALIDKRKEEYFLTKQIILNNLYGVDIVQEAVEICKLRLFLQLVSHISDIKLIEPLPDIDFNIYAGNSLAGGLSWEDLLGNYIMDVYISNNREQIQNDIDQLGLLKAEFRKQQRLSDKEDELDVIKDNILTIENRVNYAILKDRIQIKEHLVGEKSAFDFSKLFPFQRDAVNMALHKLEDVSDPRSGIFISDVVGLGKSYIALAIMSWYWSRRRKSSLIVCPAALKPMWEAYVDDYKLNSRVLAYSELYYKDDNENYTLNDESAYDGYEVVVIDEAHNFRNRETQRYRILAPYLQGKKVVLLTATPQNKSAWDIYWQIKLFHQSDVTDLNIVPNNLKDYFNEHQNNPQKIAELLQNFVIRRTRNDIKTNPKYAKLDIKFPKRTLNTVDYQIDATYAQVNKPSIYESIIDKMFKVDKKERYQYSIYALTNFLKEGKKKDKKYQGLSHFGELVRGLLKILLFKRLESSAYSFVTSLGRMVKRHEFVLQSIVERDVVVTGKSEQIELFLEGDESYKLNEYPIEDFNKDLLIEFIGNDLKILNEVVALVEPIVRVEKRDAKFDQFIKKVMTPNKDEKMLIFSEFTDTVEYIFKRTQALYPNSNIELITSSRTKTEDKADIVRRFSPNSQTNGLGLNDTEKEIQILFTSDVLSEGQNLQDAHIVVNYDFHWNPVRLIQRIGRVDRIGSKADYIKVYNFLPDEKIEEQLDLRGRVSRRINEIHQIFGSDSPILSEEESFNEESIYAIYSEKKEEVFDVDGGLTTIFDEAERILNKLEQDDNKEFQRIINLPDGIRAAKKGDKKGIFALLKAGNLTSLHFRDNSKQGIDSIEEIIKLIKAEKSDKGIMFDAKEHASQMAPVYSSFKQAMLRRKQQFSAANITPEQKYFQERLKMCYSNLFNSLNEEYKSKINRLNTIFQREIPDYAKTELRILKKEKLSDNLMIDALELLAEKNQIENFQKRLAIVDTESIRTICSECIL
ncbi:MAG: hypothetical protein LBG19_02825 [Prevotellaceae bacterium]|jgi:superfamily II DNA or RNA helicase|nr:hypothetical protein [Prevotellaceae bacterium]